MPRCVCVCVWRVPGRQGRQGRLLHVFRNTAFVRAEQAIDNAGLIVTSSQALAVVGGARTAATTAAAAAAGGIGGEGGRGVPPTMRTGMGMAVRPGAGTPMAVRVGVCLCLFVCLFVCLCACVCVCVCVYLSKSVCASMGVCAHVDCLLVYVRDTPSLPLSLSLSLSDSRTLCLHRARPQPGSAGGSDGYNHGWHGTRLLRHCPRCAR
jgi:hypothetical protein